MHGKTSLVEHIDDEIFDGVANPMTATRYHSLAVEPESVPDELVVTAWTQDDHIVQGIKHREQADVRGAVPSGVRHDPGRVSAVGELA